MKNSSLHVLGLGLPLAISAITCHAQTTVTVSTSHARVATELSVLHQAKCEDGTYGIQIARSAGHISLIHEGATRSTSDLTITGFGKTFLRRPLYGAFGFTCWNPNGINVFFFGFELQENSPPKPVSYRASVGRDGTITADHGLQTESLELVNSHLDGAGFTH